MSTERARERTVAKLDLMNLSDDEALQLLKLANEGVYETADMPEQWRVAFERMERDFRTPWFGCVSHTLVRVNTIATLTCK